MELRHLRYFVAVAEELNYKKAAARVHICAPPLFAQIKALERHVGVTLLVRDGNALKLTDAGRVFLAEARETLSRARQGVTLARQVANGEAGHVSIGYNAVAEFSIFPGVVSAFRRKYTNVRLAFHSRNTPEQLQALSQGDVEVGFICPPVAGEGLDIHELTRQPFIAVVPADHRLASLPRVSFESLSGEPLIIFSRTLDWGAFGQIQEHFARVGAFMNVVDELESAPSIMRFAAMGNGCAILPEYVRGLCPDGAICKPLEPQSIVRSLAIAKKRGNGGLAALFYQFVRDTCTARADAA